VRRHCHWNIGRLPTARVEGQPRVRTGGAADAGKGSLRLDLSHTRWGRRCPHRIAVRIRTGGRSV